MDVGAWLGSLGLEQHAEAFAENGINLDLLPELTNDDLKDLGVARLSDRKAILKAIAAMGSEAPTHDTPAPARKAKESRPEASAERRQLTVMFVDLVGSTALAERLDPEEMWEVIRAYQDKVAQEITRFDGSVAKFMGDGVLAYFGWPQAHEDDAERAVRSGLSVAETIRLLKTPAGEPPQVRVGIATGLVVVGDLIGEGSAQEESVVGTTPNLAARLQALAEPGQIVINEGTRRLARALERDDDPDPLALARHHAEAGANARAAELYLRAGHRLLSDSAVPEAVGALESGFKAMEAMPPAAERDRLELEIRAALGAARAVLWGWPHQSVLDAVKPAHDLANALNNRELLGATFWLVASHFASRAKILSLVDWVRDFEPIAVAEENAETDLPILFHLAASDQHFWMAEFDEAAAHVDRLERIYKPDRHVRIVRLINQDPISHAQNFPGSFGEWIRGYPERALERLERAVRRARKVHHPFDLVFNLTQGATCLIYLDQADRLIEQCDEAQQVASDEALGPFAEHVCIGQWRGAAHIQGGEFERGYALAKEGSAFWHRTGGRLCDAQIKCCIISALQGLGRIEEALDVNAQAIAHCRDTGDRYMEAECVRLKGELTRASRPSDAETAERLFREAIAIARAQCAKSWELRGAMSLARLLHSRDRRAEAVACLEPILNWFTEGFDTADLKEAKALRDELG